MRYSWWDIIRNVGIPKSTPPRIVPQTGPVGLFGILYTESGPKSDDSRKDGAFPTRNPCDHWQGISPRSWPSPLPEHTRGGGVMNSRRLTMYEGVPYVESAPAGECRDSSSTRGSFEALQPEPQRNACLGLPFHLFLGPMVYS